MGVHPHVAVYPHMEGVPSFGGYSPNTDDLKWSTKARGWGESSLHTSYKNNLIQKDAAIGIVYTLLFSIGIILISGYAKNADIDVDCVLFGDLGNIPFVEHINFLGINFPADTLFLLALSLVIILLISFGLKKYMSKR